MAARGASGLLMSAGLKTWLSFHRSGPANAPSAGCRDVDDWIIGHPRDAAAAQVHFIFEDICHQMTYIQPKLY